MSNSGRGGSRNSGSMNNFASPGSARKSTLLNCLLAWVALSPSLTFLGNKTYNKIDSSGIHASYMNKCTYAIELSVSSLYSLHALVVMDISKPFS